jgi:outer membrane receptor protein involved in Fe transport
VRAYGATLVLAVAAVLAVSGTASAQDPARISGVVFDRETAVPIPGVVVEVRAAGASCATDGNGAFVLAVPPGDHVVDITAKGYPPARTGILAVGSHAGTELIVTLDARGGEAEVDVEGETPLGRPSADAEEEAPATAVIEGRITREDDGTPVAGARVFARGLRGEGLTGADGAYRIEVPVGVHDLSAVHSDYATMARAQVAVGEGGAVVDFAAVPVGIVLDDLVVSAPRIEGGTAALMEKRQEAGTVSDVMGAEQMSKSGDSDAAAALKRVTGVTVVGGKYVYVRGLGERYSATLLNGAVLPSPEPERRVVPLDMFPAGVLESMVIQKTYTPDLPADFGGGAVLLRTRGFPENFALTLQVQGGLSPGSTFTRGLVPRAEGGTDWLGIDGGFRDLPGEVVEATEDSTLVLRDMFSEKGFTSEELDAISRSMPNQWGTRRAVIPPDAGLSFSVGDSYRLGLARLGFMASGLYNNSWERTERNTRDYVVGAEGALIQANTYAFDETTNNIVLGGLVNLGVDLTDDHRIRFNSLADRITDSEARVYEGFNTDATNDIRPARVMWVERMLLSEQVLGRHVIEPLMGLEIDWRYTWSRATRDEPGTKEIRYDLNQESGEWAVSGRPDGNSMRYSHVRDDTHDLGLDLALPFEQWTGEEARVKVGGALMMKDRAVDTRRFFYRFYGPLAQDPALLALPPEEIFAPENLGVSGFLLSESTRPTDNYAADQATRGLYGMADLPLGLGFRIVGGLRVEHSEQNVRTYELFNPEQVPIESRLITTDYLPAGVLSYEIIRGMLVRAGVSRTLSRPDFGELSPATKTDVVGSGETAGNPALKRATIDNYDLRWEWYFSEDESVSVGGFYKTFHNPIEMVIVPSTDVLITYENAKRAKNFGLELDFRKDFGFFSNGLADLYVAGNAAWIWSRIELAEGGNQTVNDRPLQGQSPYVINAQLGYDNADTGTTLALLYNVQGRRISKVGDLGAPDVYEEAFHQLDFVASQRLPAGFKLGFKARNIIDGQMRYTQGGEPTEWYRKGRSFSLSLAWTY